MFIKQTIFELKKFPWLLIAGLFVLFMGTMSVPIHHELTQPSYGRSTGHADGSSGAPLPTYAKNSTKAELTKDFVLTAKREINWFKHDLKLGAKRAGLNPPELEKERYLVTYYKQAIKLIQQDKGREFNDLTSKMLAYKPDLTNYQPYILSLEIAMSSFKSSHHMYRYMHNEIMRHAPNQIAAISVYSDATNLLMPTIIGWGNNDLHPTPLATTYVLLITALLLLTLAFGSNRKQASDSLLHNVPLSDTKIFIAKAVAGLLVFDGMIIAGYALMLTFIALLPGHDLGSFTYPIVTQIHGNMLTKPIIEFMAQALLFYTLWFIVLSGFTALLRLVAKSQIVIGFCLVVITFAEQLNLLTLVSAKIVQYLPAHFLNMPKLFLNFAPFGNTTMVSFTLIMGIWSIVLWTLVCLWQRLHQQGFVPLQA